ncbi:MAG: hypothetical protein ACOC20_06320 [Oceanicaulis sp.]
MSPVRKLASARAIALTLAIAHGGAFAQAEPGDGRTVFDAAYFEQFNAATALDMVARVPGFSLDKGGDERGFGGAVGNVLTLETGAETAFNYFGADFTLAEDQGAGFEPIALPVADTRVEE